MKILNENKKELKYYLILGFFALILLHHSRLSFCWSDESFYFSTVNRLLQGEVLFSDEWFPTQLVSLLLLPFFMLYRLIFHVNDGIILYFRVLYVFFSLSVSVFIFDTIKRRRGHITAMACALWYLFYVHLNIATLSYYTLSMGLFLVSMLLIYRYSHPAGASKNGRLMVLSGFFFALSVLALPTLAPVYFIAVICLAFAVLFLKEYRRTLLQAFFSHLGGIAVPAVAVLLYLFCTTGVTGIVHNIPYLLSDEEHRTSLIFPLKNFFLSVFDVFGIRTAFVALVIFGFGIIISVLRARRAIADDTAFSKTLDILNKILFAADFIVFVLAYVLSSNHTGFSATALLLFALPLFALTDNRSKDLPLFMTLFLPGLVFSLTYSYSSMCDLYVLSIGHNICVIAGICFVSDYAALMRKRKGSLLLCGLCTAAVTLCLLKTMTLRFTNIYRDDVPPRLTSLITAGPAKGLYTSPEHKQQYDDVLADINALSPDGKHVFFTKLLPWGYLAADVKCAAPTTWRTELSSQRLLLYYDEHPDKIPDVIFVMDKEIGSYESCGDVTGDPYPNENSTSGLTGSPTDTGALKRTRGRCCDIYTR